jgi:SAM-dependent methyltransferase
VNDHRWLEPLLPDICARLQDGRPLLELGCGDGLDTAVLAGAGCRVIGVDRSEAALAEARARVPGAEFYCRDLREPFPLGAGAAGVVLASLSLHYFPWAETVELVERIRRVLAADGLFVCRVNSTNDRNYGAVGHPEIDRHYYSVSGRTKRFFDRADVESLLATGWQARTLLEETIDRYGLPKVVWRVVATPSPAGRLE